MRTVLWWGRFDADYSRNRILRGLLPELGWRIVDFHPLLSGTADLEARLRRLPRPDLVWVPCFRQRDYAAARRWSRARGVPLLFDPLISAYDKQVSERGKFSQGSLRARKLLSWERRLFQGADIILADTQEHARFFRDTFCVAEDRVHMVYVGAEESLFFPDAGQEKKPGEPLEALFYGSFIPLQGAPVIVEAARRYQGPPVRWVLIGAGPELAQCKRAAAGLANVCFEPWLDYTALPERIRRADILLGVFGATPKAGRVIPNKVFQALACGRPVITRSAPAYPTELAGMPGQGMVWVPAGDALALSAALAELAARAETLPDLGRQAHASFQRYFSGAAIKASLEKALEKSLNQPGFRYM
jgi:glycosyltransferase involved in cell wall biosynthesis